MNSNQLADSSMPSRSGQIASPQCPSAWGLAPYWAKDIEIGYSLINAKAETVHRESNDELNALSP
jgi:putative SOS response-associated peptidase YedK